MKNKKYLLNNLLSKDFLKLIIAIFIVNIFFGFASAEGRFESLMDDEDYVVKGLAMHNTCRSLEELAKKFSSGQNDSQYKECREKEIKYYSKALESNDDTVKKNRALFYSIRASAYVDIGKYDEAAQDFAMALATNDEWIKDNRSSVYFGRGRTYALQHKHTQAIEDYQTALGCKDQWLESNRIDVYKTLAVSQSIISQKSPLDISLTIDRQCSKTEMTSTQYKECKEKVIGYTLVALRDSALTDGNRSSICGGLGLNYYDIGKLDDAIQFLTSAIELNEKDPKRGNEQPLYWTRGVIYTKLKRHPEAVRDFTAALKFNKEWLKDTLAYVYYMRGTSYAEQGDKSNAVEDFSTALELDDKSIVGIRSHIYYDRGGAQEDLNEAIQDFTAALNQDDSWIKENSSRVYSSRGSGYTMLGRGYFDKAIQDFNSALSQNDEYKRQYSSSMYSLRGRVYDILGKYQEALQDYEAAFRIHDEWEKSVPTIKKELKILITEVRSRLEGDASMKSNKDSYRQYEEL